VTYVFSAAWQLRTLPCRPNLSNQVNYMLRRLSLAILLATIGSQCLAAPIYYGTRAAFNAANPVTVTETFQAAHLTNAASVFTGPANSSTNNATFFPGDILPGVSFDNTPAGGSNLYVAGPNQSGAAQTTLALGSNTPGSAALEISFSALVNAAAFDVYQNVGGGAQSGGIINSTVDVYGSSGLLGSIVLGIPSNGTAFYGVNTGSDAITRIVITNSSGSFEVIDNVSFGAAEVPEPASLVRWSLGTIGLGLVARRRRMKK
jgi:hypothetical protein